MMRTSCANYVYAWTGWICHQVLKQLCEQLQCHYRIGAIDGSNPTWLATACYDGQMRFWNGKWPFKD